MSTAHRVTTPARRGDVHRSTAWLTGAVSAVTLTVGMAALASPALMPVMTRNWHSCLRVNGGGSSRPCSSSPTAGANWRSTCLDSRSSAPRWSAARAGLPGLSLTYSAAWAASCRQRLAPGRLRRRVVRHGRRPWAGWPAQLYCVFFAGYLTALDPGGAWWSILAGNATIIAFFIARRALIPTGLTRACLLFVVAAGVTMTTQQDGHGLGILVGAAIASLVLLRRRAIPA